MIQCEDEWADIRNRFKKEGLNFESLKPEEHVVLIWRWLGDCEINLKNSRKMFDKFREQKNEEFEELEHMAEEETRGLEDECVRLRKQLQSITSVISNIPLQGNTAAEKIKDLVAKHVKLKEEIKVMCKLNEELELKMKLKSSLFQNDDLVSEIIKVSAEKETLKRDIEEMTDRTQMLQESTKQLEFENEELIHKLSDVITQLQDKEAQLDDLKEVCTNSMNGSSKLTKSLELSNKCKTRCCSDVEYYENDQLNNTFKNDTSFGTDSTSPSLMVSEVANSGSSPKLLNLMDSCQELARLEENKKLQSECESLKTQLANVGEKYNNLALKYIQLKSKRKFQMEEIRDRLESSQCHIQTLQSQISIQRQRIRAEEMFRKQIEADLRKTQEEKRSISIKLLNTEMEQKENNREMSILQKKICMLDTANSELLAKLLRMKYQESFLLQKTVNSDHSAETSHKL